MSGNIIFQGVDVLNDSTATLPPANTFAWQPIGEDFMDIHPPDYGDLVTVTGHRAVNQMIAHRLFEDSVDHTPPKSLRVLVCRSDRDRYTIQVYRSRSQHGDFIFKQTVFETAARMMAAGKIYDLTVGADGLWSVSNPKDGVDLLPALFAHPDFGKGSRQKTEADFQRIRSQCNDALALLGMNDPNIEA